MTDTYVTAESSGQKVLHSPGCGLTLTRQTGVAGHTETYSFFRVCVCVFWFDVSHDLRLCFWFQVSFSPVVHVHVMRSWTFARQASRKGNWEEMARDRDRFQRRIEQAEASVGPCLSPAHRRKMRAYLDGALTE